MKDIDLGVKEWEDSILMPLKIMRGVLVAYIVLVVIVPIYKDSGLFMDSFFSFICMIILILGYLSRCGRIVSFNCMLFISLLRGCNFLMDIFFFKNASLNLVVWIIIVVVELGISFFYLMDSSRYEIVKELEEK